MLSQEEIESKLPNGIKLAESYKGLSKKHKIICPACKNIFISRLDSVIYGNMKTCKCQNISIRTGTEYVSGKYFNRIKSSAKTRKIEFDVTVEYISNLLINQNFLCALSGLPIKIVYPNKHQKVEETTASLDRIDSSRGYVEGNVQWVHKWVNLMKLDHTEEEFIDFCKRVTETSLRKLN